MVKDGFEKVPGFVTLWRKKENGKETLYAELRDNQINTLMLLQATASTGDTEHVTAGDPIDDLLFKFTKTPDDRIFLTVPNWRYRALPNTPQAKAVTRSFADANLVAFKIEAKQADRKSLLIDLSDFFKSDISQVSQLFTPQFGGLFGGGGGGGGYSIDKEKTYTTGLKNFKENLTVSTVYTFQKGGRPTGSDVLADERSVPITVDYNLFALPNDAQTFAPTNNYAPRKADPRVGYFTSEFTDLSDDSKEDRITRFIQRWDIRKKDPNAALSEPVKPIVFWLDNAIPTEYRKPVREGILMWNKAFEGVGIKNAVVVEQMPDNADWDHADMTHNIVRWVISPMDGALAVAQFRTNPLTGQILNAAVTVDGNWTRVGKLEHRALIDPAKSFAKAAGVDNEALFDGKTSLDRASALRGKISMSRQHNIENDPRFCDMGGTELRDQAWFGSFAMEQLAVGANSSPLVREKDYTDQLLRETVAHEMGHVFGLRHNFTASTQWSLEQLKDPKATGEWGISASVMDYNAFNVSALKTPGVPYYSGATGVYDRWAIEYGYKVFPATTEAEQLKRIAGASNLPGHAYQSDEMVFAGFDPAVTQYDMSADPLAYWAKMLDLSRYLLVNLDKRLPKNGESYWQFTKAFSNLLGQYASAAGSSTRYIGGLHVNRNHKGDANQQPTLAPLDVAKQKQALALLNTYLFAPDALTFPARYYTNLTTDPWGFSFWQDFPIQDQLTNLQKSALRRLFSPTVLGRVANNEFKAGANTTHALTLPTLFNSVGANVWAELGTRKPVTTLRRQLQRTYLDTMIEMAITPGSGPEDAKMLAWNQIRTLKPRLEAAQKAGPMDDYTRLHVADSLAKIDRTLKAQTMLGGGQSGVNPASLLQMLLGGESKGQ